MKRFAHPVLRFLSLLLLVSAPASPAAAGGQPAFDSEAVREMIEGYDCFLAQKYDQALGHLERARELDKKDTYLVTLLAEVHYQRQEFERVIDLLEPLAEEKGEVDSKVWLLLAYSCQAKGQAARAIDYYKKLIEQEPDDEWNRRRLLELLKNEGRYQELITYYKPLLDPDSHNYGFDLQQLGALYIRLGGYPTAREYLQKALAVDSSLADAHFLLGNLNERERRWSEALADYLQYISLNPEAAGQVFGSVLKTAQQAMHSRGEETANLEGNDIAAWTKFLERLEARRSQGDSLDTDIMRVMAIGAEALGQQEKAIRYNREIFTRHPADKFSRRSLIRLLYAEKKFDEMIEIYNSLIDPADGNYSADLLQLGALYLKTGDRGKAREALEKAIDANEEQADAYRLLGYLDELDGKAAAALENYTRHVMLDPEAIRDQFEEIKRVADQAGQPKAPREILERLAEMGDSSAWMLEQLGIAYFLYDSQGERAQKMLEGLAGRDSLTEEGYNALGYIYNAGRQYEKALAAFRRVQQARPDYLLVYLNLGNIYLAQKKFDLAVGILTEGLNRAGQDHAKDRLDLMFALGNVYHESGDDAKTEACLRSALQLDPDFSPALNYLGYFFAERDRNLEEAYNLIQKALVKEPDNGHYLDSMGWVLYKMGRFESALDYILNSLENLEGRKEQQQQVFAEVFEHLGDIYQALGRRDQAREAWSKSLEINRENTDLQSKLKKLIREERNK